MKKGLIFLVVLLCSGAFAQKKNAPVFVVGRVISSTDSSKIKELFYEGLREKTKQNTVESGTYFQKIIEIDPSNEAALYEHFQTFIIYKIRKKKLKNTPAML
jgi:hypothetical protein